MASSQRRASPLGSNKPQLRTTTPRGAATSNSMVGPRIHQQQLYSPESFSSPTKKQQRQFILSPFYKRGGTGGSGSGNASSNHRAGTFYMLLLFSLPLVFVWQWWIFLFHQNHMAHQDNRHHHQQQPLAVTPLSLLTKNHPSSSSIVKTTTSGSSRIATAALGPRLKRATRADRASADDYYWYDYSRFPILSQEMYQPHSSHPLHVILVDPTTVHLRSAATAAATPSPSLLRQGLERSRYIRLVTTWPPPDPEVISSPAPATASRGVVVHLVDWASLNRDCHLLERHYLSSPSAPFFSKNDHHHQNQQYHHVLVYYDTSDSTRVVTCPRVHALFGGNDHVRIVKQAIVVGRHWDSQMEWVVPGSVAMNKGLVGKDNEQVHHHPILHASVFLRDSFVEVLAKVLETNQGTGSVGGGGGSNTSIPNDGTATILDGSNWSQVSTRLAKRKRKLNLAVHVRKGDYARYGFLRRRVGQVVTLLGNRNRTSSSQHVVKRSSRTSLFTGASSRNQNGQDMQNHEERQPGSLRTLVRIMGDENEIESSGGEPQAEYVSSLLTAKIVIVAQHDEWEDSERLLQAMASGAMVMTDAMLAPPPGLQNGTNIVMYDSVTSLLRLALHYLHPQQTHERLQIAQRGCQLAFEKHRSWHRMEHVLFGSTRSKEARPQLLSSSSTTKQ